MLKQVFLLKRRAGMTMEEFKNYYENHHAKFGELFLTTARRYVRRYVRPQKNPLTGQVVELDFDVIMEIWWDSKEDSKAAMKKATEEGLFKLIYEDEEKLFNTHDNRVFTVEEYDTDLPRSVMRSPS
ncbi:MAG: ethyl tert-butyl ether degradation protein EthD [Rhodospirillaceae bacterium]|nr:MAG: ethyl tert-butyl ether degradation protein EthD [Rhodospirillaceae bacterium]